MVLLTGGSKSRALTFGEFRRRPLAGRAAAGGAGGGSEVPVMLPPVLGLRDCVQSMKVRY